MQTVYFPFTDVDAEEAERLSRWFGRFSILVPTAASDDLKRLDAGGTLRLVHPLPELDTAVTAAIEQATAWAADMNEKDLRYFRSGSGDIPFFSENSVSGIRSAIQSAALGKTAEDDPDVFKAKMLLGLAGLLDRQREELSAGLRHMEAGENELQRWLSDDAEGSPARAYSVRLESLPDPFAFKLIERVRAWARLALAAGETFAANDAVLLVTDSFSVFDELMALLDKKGGAVQKVAMPPGESKPGDEPFHAVLARSIDSAGNLADFSPQGRAGSENGFNLSLFRAEGSSFMSLLRQLSGSSDTGPDAASECDAWIAHIDAEADRRHSVL